MGLFIPTSDGSSIYVFDNIFTDIGDEQSIQESLSTFSGHISNIINITNQASPDSLVLIDELGSGTDPVEGSCLAISILEYLHNLGSTCLITTHYPEIKNYALVTDGFENASSSFDFENLKPTYKLLIGVPGQSNAFAISKKLGLNDDILSRAKELLEDDDVSIEELLKSIYDDKITIENEKQEIVKNRHQVELLRKSLEREKLTQVELKNDKVQKAEDKAREILLSSKEEANEIIRSLNDLYANLKFIEEIDFNNSSDAEIANFVKSHFKKGSLKKANELRNRLNSSLSNISNDSENLDAKNPQNLKNEWKKEDLKEGMNVKLSNFSEPAIITSLSGKKDQIQVQIGNARMNAKISDIESIYNSSKSSSSSNSNNVINGVFKKSVKNSFKSKDVSTEINVIGQNVEEACFAIDKYLDNCYLAKLSTCRIVHGKGTGKLREGIHSFLKTHPHVKSFRIGTFGEGEMGVTVVELK